ncbi:MAG: hypothetical protein ACRD98_00360 [Nitrososphaera sp.]
MADGNGEGRRGARPVYVKLKEMLRRRFRFLCLGDMISAPMWILLKENSMVSERF